MDPDVEIHYGELLKQWKKDDDNTKDKLAEMEGTLSRHVHFVEKEEIQAKKLRSKDCYA